MSKMLRGTVGAALISLMPISAAALTIDFDDQDSTSLQTVPKTTLISNGYEFGLTYSIEPGVHGPAIFNTNCLTDNSISCNGDSDLVPLVQGENGVKDNVLILQEDGSNIPDDSAKGGWITFELIKGTAFHWVGASAVDDATFRFEDETGQIGSISLANDRQTGKTAFKSALIEIGDTFTIRYSGSGGVDSLLLAPVPVPASLPLLAFALGGLGYAAKRRRKAT